MLSIEFILGLVGTITGCLSLVIYWKMLRKERPVIKFDFWVHGEGSGTVFDIELKNKGNKKTTIENIIFRFDNKRININSMFHTSFFAVQDEEPYEGASISVPFDIDSNKTFLLRAYSSENYAGKKSNLVVEVEVHHTQGKIKKRK